MKGNWKVTKLISEKQIEKADENLVKLREKSEKIGSFNSEEYNEEIQKIQA